MRKLLTAAILLIAGTLSAAELDLTVNWRFINNADLNRFTAYDFEGPLFLHGMSYSSVIIDNLLNGQLSMGTAAMGAYQESASGPADQLGVGYGGYLLRWTYPIAGFLEAGLHTELACGLIWLNGTETRFDSFVALEPSAYFSFRIYMFKLKVTAGYLFTVGGDMGNFKLDGFSLKACFGFNLPKG